MADFSFLGEEVPAGAEAAAADKQNSREEDNKKVVLTITQTKYRCRPPPEGGESPPVPSPTDSHAPMNQETPANSGWWRNTQEISDGQAPANKDSSLDVALQMQVVSMTAPVGADLLDGFPLFSSGSLGTLVPQQWTYTPQQGGPQMCRCVRQSLFVFNQEDHVTAEALWRVIEFCAQQRAATLLGASAFLGSGRLSPNHSCTESPGRASRRAPGAPTDALPANAWGACPPGEPFLGSGSPTADASGRAWVPSDGRVSADVPRWPVRGDGGPSPPFLNSAQSPERETNAPLHRSCSLAHPPLSAAESVSSPMGFASPSERRAVDLSREDLTRMGAAAASLVGTLPAEKLLQTYASCLLLSQSLTRGTQHVRTQADSRGQESAQRGLGGQKAWRGGSLGAAHALGAAASAAAFRTLQEALGDQLVRKIDEVLLPACCCVAYRYDDPLLMDSCYWLLKRILLDKGLPAEWKEPWKPTESAERDSRGGYGAGNGAGDANPDGAQSWGPAKARASSAQTKETGDSQASRDWDWLPPSVFQKCTGRKMCFSVARAVLTHLTYSVPLHSFWSVVADETFTKSKFLEEPKGYLHCEFRRVRSATPSTYPHVYLLLVDAASCRQLGLSEQVLSSQRSQAKVLLLCGRRQSEHSAVDFFIPFCSLIGAAEPFCHESEAAQPPAGSSKLRESADPVMQACNQKLLAVVSEARVYGKEFLGTLHGSFWGTKFSVTNWGLKQGYNHQLGASAAAVLEKRTYARLYRVYRAESPETAALPPSSASDPARMQLHSSRRAHDFPGAWTGQQERDPSPWGGMRAEIDWQRKKCDKLSPVKYWEVPYEEALEQEGNPCEQGGRCQPQREKMKWKEDCLFFASCQRSPTGVDAAEGEVVEVVSADGVGGSGREKSTRRSSVEDRENPNGATGPEGADPISVLPHSEEEEPCTIHFERNLRGDMPRQMRVRLNRHGGAYTLQNVKAKWDESLQAYSLPFFGRAKVASAKNLQLIPCSGSGPSRRSAGRNDKRQRGEDSTDDEDQSSIYFMMGKMSKDVFALDFRAPVRLFEAFAIAAATMAKKRAVT
ncbi:conserved hypothetical protein [Neospora caninum Liverpool]|uniref:Tubby C-terminal domain-containing protein n=1 Tax=Neospora caninum (strain Liverpool) TaxID=572307 RepID=F0VFI7_NEOCL|nr:conserved hypothetical protein [Neospora caninum Liverpool]CBZ52481.1 conserved hypothetical protein [Neospora caninum Liverpool]CEL66458.1 TPA: hypothetical protein BN1204_022700 [Neospora caninum Liverpool]|eukprot:XP_003882513.1 conserved hypothetical protein [Neospora caninum Liverpool]